MLRFLNIVLISITLSVSSWAESALPEDIARGVDEANGSNGDWFFNLGEGFDEMRATWQERNQLVWSASYHSILMASGGGNGIISGASGDFTLQGVWKHSGRWFDSPTELRFRMRDRHAYGGRAASEISPTVGALWGVTDGFSNSGFEVPDFFLRQTFDEIGLELRYGQLAIDSQFGGHQLASSKKYFINQGFASNPAVAFPRFGAGFTALKSWDNGFSFGMGITTVQGTQTGQQVDLKLGSSDLFKAIQLAYDFEKDDLPRRFQMLLWHSDAVEDAFRPEGEGISITYEQALNNEGCKFFSRFAWSEGGAANLDYFLTGGYATPVCENDIFGIAAGFGRGSGTDHSTQAVIESFYRWQPNDYLQITPDLQILIGEGLNTGPGVRVICGIRMGVSF